MKRYSLHLFMLAALSLLVACSLPDSAAEQAAAQKLIQPQVTGAARGALPASPGGTESTAAKAPLPSTAAVGTPAALAPVDPAGFADCPVTRPPETAFIPPPPWPASPPSEDQFWVGEADLWTALPDSGSWRQLALGEKFWWWSQEFDVQEDSTPDLTVTARRLDAPAPGYRNEEATNGFHKSFNWAMLQGVQLPSPGCWEFTGEYKGHSLSFVLWVPPE